MPSLLKASFAHARHQVVAREPVKSNTHTKAAISQELKTRAAEHIIMVRLAVEGVLTGIAFLGAPVIFLPLKRLLLYHCLACQPCSSSAHRCIFEQDATHICSGMCSDRCKASFALQDTDFSTLQIQVGSQSTASLQGCMCAGVLFFGFVISSLSDLISHMGGTARRAVLLRQKAEEVEAWLQLRQVDRGLGARITAYFSDAWVRYAGELQPPYFIMQDQNRWLSPSVKP